MKTQTIKLLLIVAMGHLLSLGVIASDDFETIYTSFQQAIINQDDDTALEVGDRLFECLSSNHRTDAGFVGLKSKLIASEFLAKRMIQQLESATGDQMQMMTGKLLNKPVNAKASKKQETLSVAPAKTFYDVAMEIFLKPVVSSALSENEIKYLRTYYNLKLRKFTSDVARAGQALTIARPDFKDTHNYVLVLPLLHFVEPQEIPLEVLPKWMLKSKQFKDFSESSLIHYGLSYHAMSFAKRAAQRESHSFSEFKFYRSAAEKCKKEAPHVAVDCMKRSAKLVENKPKQQIAIFRQIIQVWLDSGNYDLAASEAKHLTSTFGSHPDSAEAHWIYFYALSRANNSQTILKEIDDALENPQCKPYRVKMLYIKWWALRRQRDQMPRVAALEHELLKLYADNPMVAPIMLSRATDLLAGQDYNGAYEMLSELNEKFPNTKAAQQSRRILEKLKTLVNRG